MQIDLNRWWAKMQFSDTERLRLYRKMAKMLVNGLPLLKILEELHLRASDDGRKPNEPIAIILDDCRRMVQNGRMFSEGLAHWVPKTEQMIIMAGEQSGRLHITLASVIDVVQTGKKIKNVIIGGIAYPIALFGMTIAYLYLMSIKVVPQFEKIMDPHTWHGAARSLYLTSQWVSAYMLYCIVIVIAMIVGILLSMPRWRGNMRTRFDKFAPYSIYRLIVGSGFLMAFSALQFAGISVEKSLIRLSDVSGPWLRERLDGALLGIKSGLNCGEALHNSGYGFPSDEVIDDLCIYSDYKGFSEALKTLADEWMSEGVEAIGIQMKILNGFSVLCFAFVIGWLLIGFFGIQQEIAAFTRAAHGVH